MKDDAAGAAPGGPRPEFHIPSLDGLRAVSFFVVFLSHAGFKVIPGGFGVTVFFFLSGYLITTLMRIEHAAVQRLSMRDFYVRRVLRILPPFYVVLGLASLASAVGLIGGDLSLRPMLALLLHYANYWALTQGTNGQPPGTGVYWSLAVEEHFYLVFPFVFVTMQKLWKGLLVRQSAALLGLCAAVLAWRCYLVYGLHVPTLRTFLATDTRVDSILFGCALALGANPMLDPPRVSRSVLLGALLPAGLLILAATFVVRGDPFRETFRYSLQGVGLAPVFVAAMRAPEFPAFRWLNGKILRRLGLLSYSLYLVHQVVLVAFEDRGVGVVPRSLLALGISLGIAEVIQRVVEKPCARLRRRFASAAWLSQWSPPAERRRETSAPA